MFERFTQEARQAVTLAQEEARHLRHNYIGTEHLLLGLLDQSDTVACRTLSRLGLPRERAVESIIDHLGTKDLDAEALGALGIDLEAVRERVEADFGEGALDAPSSRPRRGKGDPRGHIPFTPGAKKALELSLREALALKHNYIAGGHILLGLLREGEGLATKVINDRGIDLNTVRTNVKADL